ncbi:MAG: hypothetical protein H0W08_02335 [Acidobacteria bacterium]|nr:hypothetical protein [Acidobacteriota bacterium]
MLPSVVTQTAAVSAVPTHCLIKSLFLGAREHPDADSRPAGPCRRLKAGRSIFARRQREILLSDPHSPPEFCVNGVVRHVDAWYRAFDVKPGDTLGLAPDQRVRIW